MDQKVIRKAQWLAANAVGVIAFLLSASQFWIEPELKDEPGANGGAAFAGFSGQRPFLPSFLSPTYSGWLSRFVESGNRGVGSLPSRLYC
jgi:hypothetical protein